VSEKELNELKDGLDVLCSNVGTFNIQDHREEINELKVHNQKEHQSFADNICDNLKEISKLESVLNKITKHAKNSANFGNSYEFFDREFWNEIDKELSGESHVIAEEVEPNLDSLNYHFEQASEGEKPPNHPKENKSHFYGPLTAKPQKKASDKGISRNKEPINPTILKTFQELERQDNMIAIEAEHRREQASGDISRKCFMGDCDHLHPDDDDLCKDYSAQQGTHGECFEFKEKHPDVTYFEVNGQTIKQTFTTDDISGNISQEIIEKQPEPLGVVEMDGILTELKSPEPEIYTSGIQVRIDDEKNKLIGEFITDDIKPFLELYKAAPESEEYKYWIKIQKKWEE